MKTYEDFLEFLEVHLKHITDFIPGSDRDFRPLCFSVARFLLEEPYRWEKLVADWPQLPTVEKPSRDELLEFYKTNKGLPLSFRKEIKTNDYDTLYKAYELLHPILITKHEFLTGIFREDIAARRFKKIFKESEKKIKRIEEKANLLKNQQSFIELMRKFTKDLSGFSLTLINNKKLLDQAVDKLAKD
jgi:hypothetical protein